MSIREKTELTEEEKQPSSFAHHVLENAQGIVLSLDESPTTANNVLSRHSMWGFDGSNLFININGSTYKITLTLT